MEMNRRIDAERLAARHYVIETRPSETTDGAPSWVAYVMELDGCIGQGQTREEAIADVRLAMIDYIETLLAFDILVPEPQRTRTATTGAKTTVIVERIAPADEHPTNRVVQFAQSGAV